MLPIFATRRTISTSMSFYMHLRLLLKCFSTSFADNLYWSATVLVFSYQRIVVLVTVLLFSQLKELFKGVPLVCTQFFQSTFRTALFCPVMIDSSLFKWPVLRTDNRNFVCYFIPSYLGIIVFFTMSGMRFLHKLLKCCQRMSLYDCAFRTTSSL